MTSERSEFLKSFDGNDIFFRCFTPRKRDNKESKIDGLVLAVHGFGEHSGRYAEVAEAVCGKNLAFACFDLRGHGKSGPRRGDAENLHAMILDVLFVINHARAILGLTNANDIFFGILGHSFGGLLVTFAASILHDSCPPVFLSSPLYRVKQEIPGWKKIAARALPHVTPLIHVPIEIASENLSENPENNQSYMADELNLSTVTARFGQVFLASMDDTLIRNAVGLVKAPVTVVYGSADKLVDAKRTRDIFPFFNARNCSIASIEGAGHEIFNERPEARKQAIQALLAWIDNKGYSL